MEKVLEIAIAVAIFGAVGGVLGLFLAMASKIFETNPEDRLAPVMRELPGVDCGGCGFSRCSGFAEALLAGNVEIGACRVGGEEMEEKLSKALGIETKKNVRLSAFVKCSGGNNARKKFQYEGILDCHAAARVSGGPTECAYGCIGLGSCVSACKFGAISIRNGVAVIDQDYCTGCLRCVETCPKEIIRAVPYYADVNVACSSREKGGQLRQICNIGCLGCRICEKLCPSHAIQVTENLAEIDYEKCTGCGECAAKCPRNLISDAKLDRAPVFAHPAEVEEGA